MSLSIITYALCKGKIKKTLNGLGALAGAPAQIDSITKIDGINTVKFKWVGNDGTEQYSTMLVNDGIDGKDGLNGRDGIDGIDGKDGINGRDGVNGKDGINGRDGVDGKDGIGILTVSFKTISDERHLIVTLTDNSDIDVGVLNDCICSGDVATNDFSIDEATGQLLYKGNKINVAMVNGYSIQKVTLAEYNAMVKDGTFEKNILYIIEDDNSGDSNIGISNDFSIDEDTGQLLYKGSPINVAMVNGFNIKLVTLAEYNKMLEDGSYSKTTLYVIEDDNTGEIIGGASNELSINPINGQLLYKGNPINVAMVNGYSIERITLKEYNKMVEMETYSKKTLYIIEDDTSGMCISNDFSIDEITGELLYKGDPINVSMVNGFHIKRVTLDEYNNMIENGTYSQATLYIIENDNTGEVIGGASNELSIDEKTGQLLYKGNPINVAMVNGYDIRRITVLEYQEMVNNDMYSKNTLYIIEDDNSDIGISGDFSIDNETGQLLYRGNSINVAQVNGFDIQRITLSEYNKLLENSSYSKSTLYIIEDDGTGEVIGGASAELSIDPTNGQLLYKGNPVNVAMVNGFDIRRVTLKEYNKIIENGTYSENTIYIVEDDIVNGNVIGNITNNLSIDETTGQLLYNGKQINVAKVNGFDIQKITLEEFNKISDDGTYSETTLYIIEDDFTVDKSGEFSLDENNQLLYMGKPIDVATVDGFSIQMLTSEEYANLKESGTMDKKCIYIVDEEGGEPDIVMTKEQRKKIAESTAE